jgi:4-amino-4-deoxy-L-arabinose transferase-like glycosyltransferase
MSLKVAHVVFIACACVGLAVLSVWCFVYYAHRNPVLAVGGGVAAALGLLGVLLWERRVLATLKDVR